MSDNTMTAVETEVKQPYLCRVVGDCKFDQYPMGGVTFARHTEPVVYDDEGRAVSDSAGRTKRHYYTGSLHYLSDADVERLGKLIETAKRNGAPAKDHLVIEPLIDSLSGKPNWMRQVDRINARIGELAVEKLKLERQDAHADDILAIDLQIEELAAKRAKLEEVNATDE